jgi:hypothetical protein
MPTRASVTPRASAAMLGAVLSVLSFQTAGAQGPQGAVNVGERWACRAADAGHPANIALTGGAKEMSLHCIPINVTLTTSTGRVFVIGNPQTGGASNASEERISVASPAYAGSVTASDLNDQWVEMIRKGLAVDPGAGTGTINVGDRWVCRPADANHPQDAAATGGTPATPLSCRAVNFSMRTSGGQLIVIGHPQTARAKADTNEQTAAITAPDYSGALTSAQINDRWNASVNRVFNIADSAA